MERSHEGRRSTRVRAQILLRVTSLDSASPFSEHCHTLVLNVQGCGVRLTRAVRAGLPVWLDDLPNGSSATARVANCIPLGGESKFWLVGLALDEPGNIWGLNPVPADWGHASYRARAAAAVPGSSAKRDEWPFRQFSPRGEFHPGKK
ncbi:MAG: hypothetical protein DMG90_16160 [Acidobacteria bacterium]|jgi:hypothetical protein|nr:MAG: hypothetical protein DMG91_03655 [Acidobacteriota bacterium]PYV88028.1 MAG: hypothetical protein DMG90_16160 [Acidobacteriota bacterium]